MCNKEFRKFYLNILQYFSLFSKQKIHKKQLNIHTNETNEKYI